MYKLKVTTAGEGYYNVEASTDNVADMYTLDTTEANELSECLKSVLAAGSCGHVSVHRVELQPNGMYNLLMSVSDRQVRAYTVSKRKLVELKISLMGALNG